MKEDLRILLIGLGEIGYSNAQYLAQNGVIADGHDINMNTVQKAIDAKVINRQPTTFSGYDYYLICVSTHNPQNMYTPCFDGLLEVAKRLANEGKEGALVSIESTIPKGMTKKICNILSHKLHVAHVPHRYYAPEKDTHGVNQLRVLAGCEPCCTKKAQNLYNNILGVPTNVVTSPEIAELTKIIENTHRYIEIAFAEELKIFCDYTELNFEELRKAINSKWNENILEARQGIGGHCLPKDSKMYLEQLKTILPNPTIQAAIQSDTQYRRHLKNNQQYLTMATLELTQRENM